MKCRYCKTILNNSFVDLGFAPPKNKYLPVSHIPVIDSKLIYKEKLDYLIVFPWNLISEIKNNNNNLAKNGTKFVKIIPDIEIL